LVLFAVVVVANGPGAGPGLGGFPDSVAAIGDSITQAANTDALHIGPSNPAQSWSTGSDGSDTIISHYERLLARNANIAGRHINYSGSGAKMKDAPAQAAAAVHPAGGPDAGRVLVSFDRRRAGSQRRGDLADPRLRQGERGWCPVRPVVTAGGRSCPFVRLGPRLSAE
jgi:hypothetical protein